MVPPEPEDSRGAMIHFSNRMDKTVLMTDQAIFVVLESDCDCAVSYTYFNLYVEDYVLDMVSHTLLSPMRFGRRKKH